MPLTRILLVEDNEDNRTVYRTILEHYGYEVELATDGLQGVERAIELLPDLILMDISIPVIDGLEATRRLKADQRTAAIPILALTAHALPADHARAVEAGCDGYLTKPIPPRQVMEAVRRFVQPEPASC